MTLQVAISRYCLPFQPPLQTHYGRWTHREGLYVTLTDTQQPHRQGVGEIAPLPWFGSESLEMAITLCRSLAPACSLAAIQAIPDNYPACQFGFESAWESLHDQQDVDEQVFSFSALLPTGEAGFEAGLNLYEQGYRTFKWKIGVESVRLEQDRCLRLLAALPPDCRLRLDANGGLNLAEAQDWLNFCDQQQAKSPSIEFLEQPLPVENFSVMQSLSRDYATPLALDESVANLTQLRHCHTLGWTGIYVIKPAIAGSRRLLRQFCQQHDLDIVLSTVFETEIGRRASLTLARDLGRTPRSLGYGVQHWFTDSPRQIEPLRFL